MKILSAVRKPVLTARMARSRTPRPQWTAEALGALIDRYLSTATPPRTQPPTPPARQASTSAMTSASTTEAPTHVAIRARPALRLPEQPPPAMGPSAVSPVPTGRSLASTVASTWLLRATAPVLMARTCATQSALKPTASPRVAPPACVARRHRTGQPLATETPATSPARPVITAATTNA